jgi:hypothetical protein
LYSEITKSCGGFLIWKGVSSKLKTRLFLYFLPFINKDKLS